MIQDAATEVSIDFFTLHSVSGVHVLDFFHGFVNVFVLLGLSILFFELSDMIEGCMVDSNSGEFGREQDQTANAGWV